MNAQFVGGIADGKILKVSEYPPVFYYPIPTENSIMHVDSLTLLSKHKIAVYRRGLLVEEKMAIKYFYEWTIETSYNIPEQPKFPIGTKYIHYAHKNKNPYTIEDICRVYNNSGELIRFYYVVSQEVLGRKVYNDDVPESTIARSKII